MSSIPTTHQIVGSLSGHSTFIAESIGILRRRQTTSPPVYFFDDDPCRRDIPTSRLFGSRSIHRSQELQQPSSHALSRVCLSLAAVPHVSASGWRVSDPPATGFSYLACLSLAKLHSSLELPFEASIFVFCPFLSSTVLFFGLF